MRNKFNITDTFLSEIIPSIIYLNEHWLSSEEIRRCRLGEYRLISSFSRKVKPGRGTAIYAHSSITLEEIIINVDPIEQEFEQGFENQWFIYNSRRVLN